jgi:hypothetical protein
MMKTSEILRDAWKAVQDASLPDELHEVAFREAVRLLSPQQPALEAVVAGAARSKGKTVGHGDDSGKQDGPRLSLAGIKLGKSTADRARAVAQVLTIVRGFGVEEDATPIDIVRVECIRLKVYDQKNFITQLSRLDGYTIVGSGANRRLRAKGPAVAAFPALVDSLLGEPA